ncbi:MAG: hypothetical protein AAF960_17385 [Bacteroidota bacterium]
MNNKAYYRIISQIEVIKMTDELIQKLKATATDKDEINFAKPYELRKQGLVEDLLVEMIKAKLSFHQFKNLYEKIFTYLDNGKNVQTLPDDLQKEVNQVKNFLQPTP